MIMCDVICQDWESTSCLLSIRNIEISFRNLKLEILENIINFVGAGSQTALVIFYSLDPHCCDPDRSAGEHRSFPGQCSARTYVSTYQVSRMAKRPSLSTRSRAVGMVAGGMTQSPMTRSPKHWAKSWHDLPLVISRQRRIDA